LSQSAQGPLFQKWGDLSLVSDQDEIGTSLPKLRQRQGGAFEWGQGSVVTPHDIENQSTLHVYFCGQTTRQKKAQASFLGEITGSPARQIDVEAILLFLANRALESSRKVKDMPIRPGQVRL
jgi:hypothetical protein